jgi:outer membrane immunogenic protein
MKRLHSRVAGAALASVSALAISAGTPAHAQSFNWTGFYIGANAGALWGHSDVTSSAPCTATSFSGANPGYFCTTTVGLANGAAVGAAGTGSLSGSGFTGGVQASYNWQNGNTVLGFETDFGAFHFRGAQSVSANYPVGAHVSTANTFTVGTSVEANWLFTARARIGWVVKPNILAYATGGLAVTQLEVANSFSDNHSSFPASGGGSNSATKLGWTLGGGLEWAFDKNWSAKVEYLYVDFGSVTVNSTILSPQPPGYSQAISTSADLTAHIARVGINYKF